MIIKVGKRRKVYPDHTNIEFMSLADYLKIAKRIIGHFANRVQPGLASKMLKSEDAISHVAYHLMMGAWDWDKQGGRTMRSYLNQRGFWAIKDYINKHRLSKANKKLTSLNSVIKTNGNKDGELIDLIEDTKTIEPILELIDVEERNSIEKKLINSGLTKNQCKYLLKYIEGMTYSEISEELGVSRQNAQQMVQAALKKWQGFKQE